MRNNMRSALGLFADLNNEHLEKELAKERERCKATGYISQRLADLSYALRCSGYVVKRCYHCGQPSVTGQHYSCLNKPLSDDGSRRVVNSKTRIWYAR